MSLSIPGQGVVGIKAEDSADRASRPDLVIGANPQTACGIALGIVESRVSSVGNYPGQTFDGACQGIQQGEVRIVDDNHATVGTQRDGAQAGIKSSCLVEACRRIKAVDRRINLIYPVEYTLLGAPDRPLRRRSSVRGKCNGLRRPY